MHNKFNREVDQYATDLSSESRNIRFHSYKAKMAIRDQKRGVQRKLFGDHYNYSKVGLNKEKKYMLEEQKNTQIQRANRLLLEKIQRIAKRSGPSDRKRNLTQYQDPNIHSEHSNSIHRVFHPSTKSSNNIKKIQYQGPGDQSGRMKLKIFYQGSIFFQEQVVLIKTYIENSKFTIQADIGKMKQKISIDIDTYRNLFRQKLNSDHSKITKHLSFNGKYLELMGFKNQKTTIEEEQELSLPPIANHAKSVEKQHQIGPKGYLSVFRKESH